MEISKSKFIHLNNLEERQYDEDGDLLNGTFVLADDYNAGKTTLVRFYNGYLDGDVVDSDGYIKMQKPAVESAGHIEYWRENKLHRDNGEPAVYSENFTVKEYWNNGKREDKTFTEQ